MNCFKRLIALLLIASVVILTSCSGAFNNNGDELIIGVENITGEFNPLYSTVEADKAVSSQVFGFVQNRVKDNSMVNSCGGISYEYIGDTQVKYTVTLRDDLFFSDGTHVTVDDLIFVYHLIADATYDGVYSDWHLNDIEGMDEYYYDDENYDASVAEIENTLLTKYSATAISSSDYIAYLVMTSLEGKFKGDIDSQAPNGKTWREYFAEIGYEEELKSLGDAPAEIELLKLAARAEVENNPLAYSPESYYRDIFYSEYLGKNYSDGINVTKISGINKINDYSCTLLFNSQNINTVSQVNIPIISKAVYEAEYVKGHASVIREKSADAIGCGAYRINETDDGEITLTANTHYYGSTPDFTSLRFIDLAALGKDPIDAINDGEVDVISVTATDDAVSKLDSEKIKTVFSNQNSYYSLFFNTRTLEIGERKALAGLCNFNNLLSDKIGPYYTAVYMPLSIRFPEYPSEVIEPVYGEKTFSGYLNLNPEGIRDITAYYSGESGSIENAVLLEYKNILKNNGVNLTIVNTDEAGLNEAIQSGKADIWIEGVPDGATSDKFDYYHSNGNLNKTALNVAEVDFKTLQYRSAVGFVDKDEIVKNLLTLFMEQAVECPLYQLQTVTAYNTDKISPDSFGVDFNYDSYANVIHLLKRK